MASATRSFTTGGGAARRASTLVATIRYYEEIGLMPAAERGLGGQRLYDDDDIARLTFIRRCRNLDMPIEKIIAWLTISDEGTRPCADGLTFINEPLKSFDLAYASFSLWKAPYPPSSLTVRTTAARDPRRPARCSPRCTSG